MGLLLANGDLTAAGLRIGLADRGGADDRHAPFGPAGGVPGLGRTTPAARKSSSSATAAWAFAAGWPPANAGGAVCDAIALHPVIRQGGGTMGPVHIGQFEFGPKTGLCLARDPTGEFKLLTFRGESSPQTARGMTYSAADIAVPDYRKLNRLVLDGGFPHHLAVAMGDITEDVRMLCTFLGRPSTSARTIEGRWPS